MYYLAIVLYLLMVSPTYGDSIRFLCSPQPCDMLVETQVDAGTILSHPIPASYFSMNVINEEWGTRWPASFNFYGARTFKGSWVKVQKIQGGPIVFDYPPVGSHANARNDGAESIVSLAENNHNETLMILGGKPAWYATIQEIAANIEEYREYLTAVATYFKGRVHYYESWNEPEQQGFMGNAQILVDFTKEIYQIVKAIDPSVTIVCPAMNITGSGTVSNLLDEFLALGGADWCDVIGFHSYLSAGNYPNPPLPPEATIDRLMVIKNILALHQVSKPIWNTETGYNLRNHDNNPIVACGTSFAGAYLPDDTAYAYLPRLLIISWFHGVERFYWYAYGHRCMGFLEDNLQDIKANATVYREIQKWLVGKDMVSLMETNGVWQAELTTGKRTEYILWTTTGEVTQTLPSTVTQVSDVLGKISTLTTLQRDQFLITIQPQWVY